MLRSTGQTLIGFFAGILFCLTADAQHYIYVECDNPRSFHAKTGDKSYATASGFLIIPKITGPTAEIAIGFPDSSRSTLTFLINLNGQDRGFQLKMFEGKGWGLFDRTTMDVQMATAAEFPSESQIRKQKQENFGALLSAATNDPSLTLKATSSSQNNTSTLTGAPERRPQPPIMEIEKRKPVAGQDSNRSTYIVKIADESDQQTTKMVFLDKSISGNIDTVSVQVDRFSTDLNPPTKQTPAAPLDLISPKSEGVKQALTACNQNPTTEKELRALQKKLLGTANETDQIQVVEKALRSRCITSQQALELGSYFTRESNRLELYKKIYPLISDPQHFGNAVMQFADQANRSLIGQMVGGEQ
jgi:hypothetical protein